MARHLRVAPAQLGAMDLLPFDQLCPAELSGLITARTGVIPPPLD